MKNKMAKIVVLLACQTIACAAAFAFGDNDQSMYGPGAKSINEQSLLKVAQGDMYGGDSPALNASGAAGAEAASPGKGTGRHGCHAGRRKHFAKGQHKRHIGSRFRHKLEAEADSGSTSNTCCAPSASAM